LPPVARRSTISKPHASRAHLCIATGRRMSSKISASARSCAPARIVYNSVAVYTCNIATHSTHRHHCHTHRQHCHTLHTCNIVTHSTHRHHCLTHRQQCHTLHTCNIVTRSTHRPIVHSHKAQCMHTLGRVSSCISSWNTAPLARSIGVRHNTETQSIVHRDTVYCTA